MPEINGVTIPFLPVGGIDELNRLSPRSNNGAPPNDFGNILREELDKLKFSAHAKARMESREIDLNNEEIERLGVAVNKAREKGANDLLVMLDQKAFIVNAPNNTVVTVVNANQMENKIITNIDSAVFA